MWIPRQSVPFKIPGDAWLLQPRFGLTRNKAILGYAFASLSQALDSRTDARGYRVYANGVVLAHFLHLADGAIAVSDTRLTNDKARRELQADRPPSLAGWRWRNAIRPEVNASHSISGSGR